VKRLLVLLVLGACAHSAPPVATEADVARASGQFPGITVEELNRGRSIYAGRCSSCHQPPAPTDHRVDEWPGHVAEMSERARLTDEEEALVVRYVQVMSTAR
jgi:mono/diheme cytochrome c family protein